MTFTAAELEAVFPFSWTVPDTKSEKTTGCVVVELLLTKPAQPAKPAMQNKSIPTSKRVALRRRLPLANTKPNTPRPKAPKLAIRACSAFCGLAEAIWLAIDSVRILVAVWPLDDMDTLPN